MIILDMERRSYGLRPQAVRKIVYQYCVENNTPHTCNEKSAGKKWLRLFLGRHQELCIRKPKGVSIQRAQGYNNMNVVIFEKLLKNELFDENGDRRIPVENIFNVDETGFSVNQKPTKILAQKGKKCVSVTKSAEKGKTITAVCCVSATGVYCPPFLIFPRKRFKAELLDRGPVGAVGAANASGWINEELFLQWFDHFSTFSQPLHRSSPSLLIMDGQSSHTNNLHLVTKAKATNVILLVLPSHCTHKIQPVAVFKSLKTHYDRAVETWLHAHPGRAVQEYQVAELFADAWGKAATVRNAVCGFEKSRINPFMESTMKTAQFQTYHKALLHY